MSFPGDPALSAALQRQLEAAVQESLAGVQDYVNFTLQRAYFKCGYECFDRKRGQHEISSCVERCSVPVLRANSIFENEMARFQERLSRSLMVCQDKSEAKRLLKQADGSSKEFEQCVEMTVKEHIKTLPHLADQLKSQMPGEADKKT